MLHIDAERPLSPKSHEVVPDSIWEVVIQEDIPGVLRPIMKKGVCK